MAVPRRRVDSAGLLSVTWRSSSDSSTLSGASVTLMVAVVSPGAMVTVPAAAVKSAGEAAVPSAVAQFALTATALAPVRSTANRSGPDSSSADASRTDSEGRRSSSTIVTVALGSLPSDASAGLLNVTVNVSSVS